MALIFDKNKYDDFCGGSLIAPQHVLTSFHFFNHHTRPWERVIVRLGEHDRGKKYDCEPDHGSKCAEPIQDFSIKMVFSHPDYPKDKTNDIALVKLDRPAIINAYVQPINLPINDPSIDQLDNMFIAKWGRISNIHQPTVLQFGAVNVIKNHMEPHEITLKNMKAAFRKFKLGKNQILAGGNGTVNHCPGDSGSPLMYCSENNVTWLYAIAVKGRMSCEPSVLPDIYLKVAPYVEWVVAIVNNEGVD